MTTTTPESRGRIAYTAYVRSMMLSGINPNTMPLFDALPEREQQAWIKSASVLWDLATTGRAEM